MLQISHLYADYGGKPALEDINLTLAALASGDLKHWHVSGFTYCMVGSRSAATD